MANSNSNYIKNVAIIGKFDITVITRTTTNVNVPQTSSTQGPSFKIFQGSYDDKEFLVNALKGVEVLILALGFTAVGQYQLGIIEAAIESDVQWILPTEYSGDNGNPSIRKISDCLQNKTPSRETIERLGGKWIGIVTGLRLGTIIKANMIGINTINRKATLFDHGTTHFNVTNVPLIGTAIAHLLSLPINPTPGENQTTTLSSYTDKFLYIRSHLTSQLDILRSIQQHTKTSDSDWEITHASAEEFINQGKEKGFRGEVRGWGEAYLGMCLLEGAGGDFEEKAVKDMEALGLTVLEEGLDEWVGKALE